MHHPIVRLLVNLIDLYIWCVIVWGVVQLLVHWNVINRFQPFVRKAMQTLDRLIEPALRPIQRVVPPFGTMDISPILLLLGLNFLRDSVLWYF